MARPNAADRARRLVALLRQLEPDTRHAIADLAAEVGSTESELAADLISLSCCGVAPYDPGDLVPIMIEDGFVEVFGELPALGGPVRLSPAEALALAAALQAAGFSAGDELTSRLLSAAGATEFDATELERTVRADAGAHGTDVYQALAQSVDDGAVVRIEYVRLGGEPSSREIEPLTLFAERGAWYVTAWCRFAGDWRTFRLDRIVSAGVTGERFDPAARASTARGLSALDTAELPVATLRFAPGVAFVEREWPGGRPAGESADGGALAEVPYAGTEWLARHVVARLGTVEVVEPANLRSEVTRLAGEQLAALP